MLNYTTPFDAYSSMERTRQRNRFRLRATRDRVNLPNGVKQKVEITF